MPNDKLTIEILTEDRELLAALKNEKLDGVRLMTRAFTCDTVDWIPPVERVFTYIVETSNTVVWSLLTAWLYDRFKTKPPEQIIINNITVSTSQEMVTIINKQIEATDRELMESRGQFMQKAKNARICPGTDQ